MLAILQEKYDYVLEEKLLKTIAQIGQYRKLEEGVSLIDIGDKLAYMPLVLSGAIRIMKEDADGNELLLYYLEIGDTCAMTISCCLGEKRSKIRAVTEQATQLILIPVSFMEEWTVKYQSWRAFVFNSYSIRLAELLEAIDILAFHNMESQLYKYLKDKAMIHHDSVLEITHSQVAKELNSSRVVISRLMKKLSLDGKIKNRRNSIEVLELSG